jgi:hypothetical protein
VSLRLDLLKICYAHGRERRHVIEDVLAYEQMILDGDKAEKPRPTLTAGKTVNADAGAKR